VDFFPSPPLPDLLWGPSNLLSNRYREYFPGGGGGGIKRLGRETKHTPPSSAEVNAWSYNFTPQYVFMAWCLIKQEIRLQ
jgi:hypothetical protein